MQIKNTIIVPIIRADFIPKMLKSLYQYTPPNFRVIVIDQTKDDRAQRECQGMAHLWIKSYRNLGFSKAMNTGIVLSTTPYITLANDDIEFINGSWWQGIEDTFKMDERILAVNPMSPKEGAFGYGLTQENRGTWKPRSGFFLDPNDPEGVVPDFNGEPMTLELAKENYNFLLDSHPVWAKDTLCDGLAMWCTVFKKEGLEEVGLLDERFYPGSGEDYDMMGRIYSCAWPQDREDCDINYHKRAVGTTKSWVWHHWGKSKEKVGTLDLEMSRSNWNNLGELWPGGFDQWGHLIDGGTKKPYRRDTKISIDDL